MPAAVKITSPNRLEQLDSHDNRIQPPTPDLHLQGHFANILEFVDYNDSVAAMKGQPKTVVIVVGSITALMHAIVLMRLGHNVRILEANSTSTRERQGAGIMAGECMQEFMNTYDISKRPYRAHIFRLANFDGLRSLYCLEPLALGGSGNGEAVFETGKTVTDITYSDGLVTVHFDDARGVSGSIYADLVIGADGARSIVRQIFEPSAQFKYAGSMSRCTVNNLLDIQFLGTTVAWSLGKRMLNYIPNTIPIGKMRKHFWTKQKVYANKYMPAPLAEAVNKTTQQFVAIVRDASASRTTFFDGEVLLVGDALMTMRPHVASSTNHAALNALLLEKAMKGDLTVAELRRQSLQYGEITALKSVLIAAWSLSGYRATLLTPAK
ncbi:hypothetical protein MMC11_007089 [Xylographa trunciseda]|nr:hypothetical protein [Xylographa trunciseda]